MSTILEALANKLLELSAAEKIKEDARAANDTGFTLASDVFEGWGIAASQYEEVE